jgi:hypothetical protein
MNHEPHEPHERANFGSAGEAFDMGFWRASKVYEQGEFQSGSLEIVQNLRAVFRGKFPDRLELDDNAVEAHEIGPIGLPKALALVGQIHGMQGDKGYVSGRQLQSQALLIYRFQETRAHVPVDLENGALDRKSFITEK